MAPLTPAPSAPRTATELGRAAHARGAKRIPGGDPAAMSLLAGLAVGTGAVRIFREWTAGWEAARDEAAAADHDSALRHDAARDAAALADREDAALRPATAPAPGITADAMRARIVGQYRNACFEALIDLAVNLELDVDRLPVPERHHPHHPEVVIGNEHDPSATRQERVVLTTTDGVVSTHVPILLDDSLRFTLATGADACAHYLTNLADA